ncbi:MAG: WYL domain-containing protein [Xanthobacteraceae bacterium]
MTAKPRGMEAIGGRRTASTPDSAGWRLAVRGPIRAYDEHSDREIELHLGQSDPKSIEGLLIDFRYVTRDREISRRSVLCWQCGRDGDRLYVRGYCAFREELRTFRIDRMSDLVAIRGEQASPVEDIAAFFAAFVARDTRERRSLGIEAQD